MQSSEGDIGRWLWGAAVIVAVVATSSRFINPLTAPQTPQDGVVLTTWWFTAIVSVWFCASVSLWVFALRSPKTWLASLVRRIAMPGARKFAETTFAITLMVSPAACSVGGSEEAPTLRLVATNVVSETTATVDVSEPTTTTPAAAAGGSDTTPRTSEQPPSTIADSVASNPPTSETTPDEIHEVLTGDNLWSIATSAVRTELGSEPTSRQITTYWKELVALNRNNILSGDPDLIYPGEVLLLPAPE